MIKQKSEKVKIETTKTGILFGPFIIRLICRGVFFLALVNYPPATGSGYGTCLASGHPHATHAAQEQLAPSLQRYHCRALRGELRSRFSELVIPTRH